MKIVHAIPYMHPNGGGPPVVVDRFCRNLVARGHDVEVITTNALVPEDDDRWHEIYQDGYQMKILPAWRKHVFAFCPTLHTELLQTVANADLVHVHNLWSYMNVKAAKICQELGVPLIVSTHGMLDPNSLSRKPLKKALYGRLIEFAQLRRCNAIMFTHKEEERLARQCCSNLPLGLVVPLGSDKPPLKGIDEAAQTLYSQYPELINKKKILFLGRIHSKKGLDLLIPALEMVLSKIPEAHLVLAGPVDPTYRHTLEREILKLNISDSVTWLGTVQGHQKWATYSIADVFVLPSYQENFAITVVEAMSMGKPIVLSNRVNIWREVVENNIGTVCELTVQSLQAELVSILSEQSLNFERRGPELVAEMYNWETATTSLLDAYSQVVST